jgi:molybdopterin-containing oxidoreductase family membrane subunit
MSVPVLTEPAAPEPLDRTILEIHRRTGPGYLVLVGLATALAGFGAYAFSLIFRGGLHWTGLQRPEGWGGWDICNFVFWVGIAHCGTLVSAILYLFRARFRTAVYRVAEMMTVFAVMTAGLFPIMHLGRPWLAYWLFPYPNQRGLWINFRSPLIWDVFAVSTYLTVSLIFLLVGVVPDAAALRDATTGLRRRWYALLAMGWRGTDEQWRHHTRAYLFLAGFATPLVVSVHSVVSWDFAVSLLPGWHSSLFPPYFVAGAILSGVAMLVTILVPLRRAFRLQEVITTGHLDMLARLVLLTSLIVAYAYVTELGLALPGPHADPERSTLVYRATGDYAPLFWTMVACNCGLPLLFLFRRMRRSPAALLAICIPVNLGMWLERWVIIVSSLSHDRLPFLWRVYKPTWVEWAITLGAFGWFFVLFLVGLKLLPPVSIAEMEEQRASEAAEAAPEEVSAHAG